MPSPIPLICGELAGTGFLVVREGRFSFVTCLHLITGVGKSLIEEVNFHAAAFQVIGTDVTLPCIVKGVLRVKVVERPEDNYLADVVSLHLSPEESAQLAEFGAFEYDSIIDVALDAVVTMKGFAGQGFTLIEATETTAHVIAAADFRVALSEPSIMGMSGGPVVGGDGSLVGIVYGDQAQPPAPHFSATVAAFKYVGPYLF